MPVLPSPYENPTKAPSSLLLDLNETGPTPIASVRDRILAAFLDFTLFIPLYAFLLSQLEYQLELKYWLDPYSIEFFIYIFIGFFIVLLITLFLQSLFTTNWGATPGQKIMKLEVIPEGTSLDQRKLSWEQSLLRSFFWFLSLCFLGFPFLEVFTHPLRKTLHDKVSDSIVVTRKKNFDPGPTLLEAHLVRNVMITTCMLLLIWVGTFVSKLYTKAEQGDFKRAEMTEKGLLCPSLAPDFNTPELAREEKSGEEREDLILAQFLTGILPKECLESESNFLFYTNQQKLIDWAYLMKGFYYYGSDQEKSKIYFKKVCSNKSNSLTCTLAQKKSNLESHPNTKQDLSSKSSISLNSSLSAMVLEIKSLQKKERHSDVLQKLSLLEKKDGFEGYIQKERTKTYWNMEQYERAIGAYENTKELFSEADVLETSAWMCWNELGNQCQPQISSACNELSQKASKMDQIQWNEPLALSYLKHQNCVGNREISNWGLLEYMRNHNEIKKVFRPEMTINQLNQLIVQIHDQNVEPHHWTSKDKTSPDSSKPNKSLRLPAAKKETP